MKEELCPFLFKDCRPAFRFDYRGAAIQFVHPTKPGTVTVPHPKKDLGKGLVRAIRKQAGLR